MFNSSVCRDEDCERLDLHPEHQVKGPKRKRAKVAELIDSDQGDPEDAGKGSKKAKRPPWLQPASKALTNAIAKATSKTYVKHFDALLHDVKNDYGDCNSRTVHRHLKELVARGHVKKIDLGSNLYAYIRPNSTLEGDVGWMREQVESQYASSCPDE